MEIFKKKEPSEIIKGKYDDYNAALADADEAVEAAKSKFNAADTARAAAADQNDAAAFAAAKKQLAEAETALEMATLRKDRIISRGPCPEEEVKSAISYYNRQRSELDRETAVKLLALYDQIAEVCKSADSKRKSIAKNYKDLLSVVGKKSDPFNIDAASGLRSIGCVETGRINPLISPHAFDNEGLKTLRRMAGRE